jgi:hypothetical protein
MKKEFKLGKDIIPNPDTLDIDEFKEKILKRFNISITFLYEDGVIIEYDDSKFDAKNSPGDFSLFDTKSKCRVLTILDYFGSLDFFGVGDYDELGHDDAIYSIETLY